MQDLYDEILDKIILEECIEVERNKIKEECIEVEKNKIKEKYIKNLRLCGIIKKNICVCEIPTYELVKLSNNLYCILCNKWKCRCKPEFHI